MLAKIVTRKQEIRDVTPRFEIQTYEPTKDVEEWGNNRKLFILSAYDSPYCKRHDLWNQPKDLLE